MKNFKSFARTAIACAFCAQAVPSFAVEAITFDIDGPGGMSPLSVVTFDWIQNNALAVDGNPAAGLMAGDGIHLLAHARLGVVVKPDGGVVAPPAPSEFTFVAGFAESVANVDGGSGAVSFEFDAISQAPNFFEIWVNSPADSVPLQGTGYNNGKRILYGVVTASSGNYTPAAPRPVIDTLDKFLTNNYPGIVTLVGSGSTQLSGVIVSADPDYFPGLTPTQIASLKVFFNTSTVTPFQQSDPSANFVPHDAGADGSTPPPANVAANIGNPNGVPQGTDLNFIFQADSNQAFEQGEVIEGTCRVTYGGNDKNGNIDLKRFGQVCAKEKGKESCYTFGGQVGAPTTNPNLGGPFGEHTHHQVLGDAGDFVFRAGSRSAPKTTRITAVACKDPGAIQPAAANALFKQIDFEGTGTFRTLSDQAKTYLIGNGGPADIAPDNVSDKIYYFRVDMVDAGEPGNKGKTFEKAKCAAFLADDQNNPLATADPLLLDYVASGGSCPDVYQFYVCPSEAPCEEAESMYAVRAFLTGGNIQLHKVVK